MNSNTWRHYLIELIVVFIGLTLALLMDSWYDSYKDGVQEGQFLDSFSDDINSDIAQIDTILITNKRIKRSVDYLIKLLKDQRYPMDTVLYNVSSLADMSSLYPQKSTYESITGSGKLYIINDYQLKKDIVNLYQLYEQAELIDNIYQSHITDYIGPFIMKHLDFNRGKIDISKIKSNEFFNMIALVQTLNNQNISFYTSLLNRSKELNKKISVYLEQ